MSLKHKALGTCASAARGILMTGGTNASPIVATVTAGHRQRNGNRLAIAGVTGLTAMNGEWSISSVGATAATLDGSVGNGTFGGTAVVAAICDVTPFQPRHSAVAAVYDIGVSAVFVGTVVIEGADSVDASAFSYTNGSGVATAGFKDMLMSGEIAIPAQATVGGGLGLVEVQLARYMTMRASAYTSGSVSASLLA